MKDKFGAITESRRYRGKVGDVECRVWGMEYRGLRVGVSVMTSNYIQQ